MSKNEEEQEPRIFERRQVMIGVGILGVFLLLVLALMLGWRKVPGVVGETLGIFAGIISTPFLLEFSFVVAGLLIVVGLNSWRRHREGDELVYLEEAEGLPERSGRVIYRERPLDGEVPDVLMRAEGALDIGDFDEVAAVLGEMDDEQLKSGRVMDLRIRLAEQCGKEDLARALREERGEG